MRHAWTLCVFFAFFTGAAHGDAAPVLLFPGVTHAAGGAESQAAAVLNNPTATPQSILLELLPPGGAIASASRAVVLAPGERREISDLHAFLGAADGVGMLRVTGPVQAKVRLRREDDNSGWEDIPAVNPERPIAPDEEVDFPYSTPPDVERAARSNLILVNLDTRDVTVTISQGSITARKTIPAGAFVQIDNLGGFLGAPAGIASAHAVADGRWFGAIMTVRTLAVGQRRRAVAPPEKLLSSFDLIDKALAAGTINAEQALTYKVFADFSDPRLPASLKGDDSSVARMDSTDLARQQWSTLSPATRDLIGPFLVPPFYEGSWWDLRRRITTSASAIHPLADCRPWEAVQLCNILTEWRSQAGSHVRVWYEADRYLTDGPAAADMVDEVDAKIWSELIKVMGPEHEPLLDHVLDGKNLLDVVLTNELKPRTTGKTQGLKFLGCNPDPTYILINRNFTDVALRRSILAHELFHAVQHTYTTNSCVEIGYKWLMESTATWFEDELYPGVNREHDFAHYYLDHTDLSIDASKGLSSEDIDNRYYGAYTFFFYLTRIREPTAPDAVRLVWEATKADALHALAAGLATAGAPLEKSWPDFALYSWNAEAPFNRYYTDDKLSAQAHIQIAGNVTVPAGDQSVQLGDNQLSLPHLSMRYFQFDFPDDTASSVVFYNGIQRALNARPVSWIADFGNVLTATQVGDPASITGAHVDALLKIDGKWTHEDWTGKPFKTYCRDLKKERIESLVIILSNSDIASTLQPQGKYPPIVQATNIGCYAWEGTADLTYDDKHGRVEKMTVSNLRLETLGDVPDDEDTPLRRLFTVSTGTFNWSISGETGGCTWSAPPVVRESLGQGSFLYTFPYAKSPAAGARGILPLLFQEWLGVRLMVKQTGTACGTDLDDWHAPVFFLVMQPDESYAQLSSDGKSYTLDASKTLINDQSVTGTWKFTAKRE